MMSHDNQPTFYVIGAGLAGLAAAHALARQGRRVVVSEAAPMAGGRCRAWHDASLDRRLDNGTHMVVGGNPAVWAWLKAIGAQDRLRPAPAALPMVDLKTNQRWDATPSALWRDGLATLWRLLWPGEATTGQRLSGLREYQRFWEPLILAILNVGATEGSARLFRAVLARTLWRGPKAAQAYLAKDDLADTFVTPALAVLDSLGVAVRYGHRLRALEHDQHDRLVALAFEDDRIALGPQDRVILAVPWYAAQGLLPHLPRLTASPIVNVHYRLNQPTTVTALGLLNGHGQWIFGRGDVVSVTISAAQAWIERDNADIAARLWPEVAQALSLTSPPLAARVIKEKRATLLHTPAMERLRPPPRVSDTLVLAGDWTNTGLPCTLEGALQSGLRAAALSLKSLDSES